MGEVAMEEAERTGTKKRRVASEESIVSEENKGKRISVLGLEQIRRLGALISGQRENKRLTITAATEMEEAMAKLEEAILKLGEENARLEGSLEENRRNLAEVLKAGFSPMGEDKEREVEKETEVEVEIEVDGGAPPTKIKRKRRRKKENKAGELPAKLVRMKDLKVCEELPVARSEKDTNQFTTVVCRRVVKADRESEDRKKEALRKKELPKSFIVRGGEKGLGEVKKSLWSEIVGRWVLPR
uniref:Uncharacterized protein n=1 Tax=Sipha flava TaxID=143950 RepID=A0A2S2PYH8_9HEMI